MAEFAGIDVNVPDSLGYTALHKSCLTGNWDMVGKLIDAGGDLRIRDREGRDALWFTHLHLKSARAMAERELWKGGVDASQCPGEVEAMSNARARLVGKKIYEATLQATH